jgi:hypothetical protein
MRGNDGKIKQLIVSSLFFLTTFFVSGAVAKQVRIGFIVVRLADAPMPLYCQRELFSAMLYHLFLLPDGVLLFIGGLSVRFA